MEYIPYNSSMENLTIEFYKKENNDCPVQDFLDSLDFKMQAKMYRIIALLKEHGTALRLPYSEFLADGIFELRAKQGSDITRILYFFVVGNRAVLTHGFVKKTQKTPPGEIEKAKKFRDDYCLQKKLRADATQPKGGN